MIPPSHKSYRAVFISPHLDDSVFSCGGTIAKLCKEGPVLVINVFTRYDSDVKHYGVVFTEERRTEEAKAAEFLGYTSINLDEPDAFFRRPEYRSLSRIFGRPVADDLADLPRLSSRISEVLAGIDSRELYAPLGIGWHVDHMLCHMAARNIGRDQKLLFYEDAPYCFIPQAARYRVDEFGTQPAWQGANALLREWVGTCHGFLRTALVQNIRPWLVRGVAGAVSSLYLLKLMFVHRRSAGNKGAEGPLQLGAQVEDISGCYEQKAAAMLLYRSQFREFFTGRQQCDELHREYAGRISFPGAVCERFWRAEPDLGKTAECAQ